MAKPANRFSLQQWALACFVLAAVGSLALSLNSPPAWILVVPCVRALFWELKKMPPGLVKAARYTAYLLMAIALITGLLNKTYPILSDETVKRPLLVSGYCLAAMASLFLLGRKLWRPAETLFPSAMAVFAIAAINPVAPRLHLMMAIAGTSAFIYLITTGKGIDAWSEAVQVIREEYFRLSVTALAIFLIAGSIIQVLPWLQVRVVQATNRMVIPQTNFYAGLSGDSQLGDLEELHLSQRVVMRVWTSQPQKLRGRVFTQFDGKAWHSPERFHQDVLPLSGAASGAQTSVEKAMGDQRLAALFREVPGNNFALPGSANEPTTSGISVATRIVQSVYNSGLLVSPGNKVLVRMEAPYLRLDAFQSFSSPPTSTVQIYGVLNRLQEGLVQEGPDAEALASASLALPANTDVRLKELAQTLAAGTKSPSECVQRTIQYIQSRCQYSLKIGAFNTQQPVSEFLFEKRQGYCEYFASALAVLLRLENVPARYVTGFNVQDGNREGGHYVVREADAHAWIEVYIPAQGWVEFDPTPEAEYAALHSNLNPGWFATSLESVAAALAELSARLSQIGWVATLQWLGEGLKTVVIASFRWPWIILLLLTVLLVVKSRWTRRRRRVAARKLPHSDFVRTAEIPEELAHLLQKLDQAWSRSGYARPPSRGPLEHARQIPPGKVSPIFRDCCLRVIDFAYAVLFGGVTLDVSEARHLMEQLDRTTTV